MDEQAIEQALELVITGEYEAAETALAEVQNVDTLFNAGALTTDRGLVLHMRDGTEFQITIVRSR